MFFFFFKQKTAYEMRISDWSSDVCSSDLSASQSSERGNDCCNNCTVDHFSGAAPAGLIAPSCEHRCHIKVGRRRRPSLRKGCIVARRCRSEEHTSELQSLMRN